MKKIKEMREMCEMQEIPEANPLGKFSDQDLQKQISELQKEVTRRTEIKKKAEYEAMLKRQEVIYKHIDDFLELATHSRTSCSDKDPCNSYEDCVRCWLLHVKMDGGIFDNRELTFQIKEN